MGVGGGPGDAADKFAGAPLALIRPAVNHSSTSRMANALYRLQTRLWRAPSKSIFPKVIGTRWMSKSQSPLSEIEVPSIFFLQIVLMSVLELSMEGWRFTRRLCRRDCLL